MRKNVKAMHNNQKTKQKLLIQVSQGGEIWYDENSILIDLGEITLRLTRD